MKEDKIIKEFEKRHTEEKGTGGYFTKLQEKDGVLKSFKFRKEVLNAYSQKIPTQRFIIDRGITNYLRDKEGVWGMKFSERKDSVSALSVDLTGIPKADQDWWADNLIEED